MKNAEVSSAELCVRTMELSLDQRLHGEEHRPVDVVDQVKRRQNYQRNDRVGLPHRWRECNTGATVVCDRGQLLLRPWPARFHKRTEAPARVELATDFAPHGFRRAHDVVENAVHDVFLEDAKIAVGVYVFL